MTHTFGSLVYELPLFVPHACSVVCRTTRRTNATSRSLRSCCSAAAMGPWARQAEFESGLARLRKPSPALLEELTALALAEPRSAYKGVIGALAHAIKKAKARHRCARRVAMRRLMANCSRRTRRLPLLSLLSAVLCEARDKFGAANLYGAPGPLGCRFRTKCPNTPFAAERARPELVRCVAAACRCPPEQLVRSAGRRSERPRWVAAWARTLRVRTNRERVWCSRARADARRCGGAGRGGPHARQVGC